MKPGGFTELFTDVQKRHFGFAIGFVLTGIVLLTLLFFFTDHSIIEWQYWILTFTIFIVGVILLYFHYKSNALIDTHTKIFISYRMSDTQYLPKRLIETLEKHFLSQNIFYDKEAIEPGDSLDESIIKAINQCDVLLLIMSRNWLGEDLHQNTRKIDSKKDWVRREIEQALKNKVRIIPLLLDGVKMPSESNLPDSIKSIVDRSGLDLRSGKQFELDILILANSIKTPKK